MAVCYKLAARNVSLNEGLQGRINAAMNELSLYTSGRKLPYASLPQVRAAILERRQASFVYGGENLLVEPHLLGACSLSSAFILRAYVLGAKPRWRNFRFATIRDFRVQATTFTTRPEAEWHSCKISGTDTSPLSRR